MNAKTRLTGQDAGVLGLGTIIVGSLPETLLTDDAPERYTVEAVFTRKPDRNEVAAILARATRRLLTEAGYPEVELTVSDRRLEIANTTLEELRNGLAATLGARLAEISVDVQAERDDAAARFRVASDREEHRAAAVVALAESIAFAPRDGAAASARASTAADRVQERAWNDEGGAGSS